MSYPPTPSDSAASYAPQSYSPQSYPQQPYPPQSYPPQPYGQPYLPQPYAQQPYPQQPYAQQPYAQQPYAQPGEAAKTNGRRYQLIFGSALIALTVLALALAAIAPGLNAPSSSAVPANWQPVYESNLTAATPNDYKVWDLTKGCSFYSNGLYADASQSSSSSAAICEFTPAGSGGVTGKGFYFELGLAPAWQVSAYQRAMLLIGDFTKQSGNQLVFEVDQMGHYVLCDGSCSTTDQGLYISGGTAAWHGDAYVANTISIQVSPDHMREIFYVNGQQVATASLDMGAQPALALGAPSGSEAIFTRATLSTGQ